MWATLAAVSGFSRGALLAVLAFAAWLAGHGAMAWCAVERARAQEPSNVLAGLVAQALEEALPPSSWVPMDPGSFPLSEG